MVVVVVVVVEGAGWVRPPQHWACRKRCLGVVLLLWVLAQMRERQSRI